MNVHFDQGPLLHGFTTREPSLRQLVHKYYEQHFNVGRANQLALQYIRGIEASAEKPNFAVRVATNKWEALKEQGYRMTSLNFERCLQRGEPGLDPSSAHGVVTWTDTGPAAQPVEPKTCPYDSWQSNKDIV